ncbi:MAG: Tfp pilus assembly protein FimT/FimU [Phycisphaeraceae bacterium JB051]
MNRRQMHAHRKQQGFTLVEMLTVVVVVGILSALMVPMLGDTSQSKLIAAANHVAADIAYAQIESISHADDLRFVIFDLDENSYYIAPTSDTLTPVINPIGNRPYLVQFGTSNNRQLSGVSLSNVSLNGDDRIRFGVYGELDQATEASVTLTCDMYQITVFVDPTCGDVRFSDITEIPAE